ncbi:MAG: glycoside hydrolase family 127 protein [bacterium]|nr:glycoside hydrolase family 127 protein [bacterium]
MNDPIKPIDFAAIQIEGDLALRANQNFNRLEEHKYQPDYIFAPKNTPWPGDTEGRTILALASLAQAIHRNPKYLSEIIARIPAHINELGYFGELLPDGIINEHQLAGNSWVLRGLLEFFNWTKDNQAYQMAHTMVENYVISTRGKFRNYPTDPELREGGAEAGSIISGVFNNWQLSTDVCAYFIFLDGATHAYQLFPSVELKQVIEEVIETIVGIDFLKIKAQTHSTLSGVRGIIRYYEISQQKSLLTLAERIYRLYREEAITENYANYNWFQRPEWTEPCAMIDSFIVAVWLWKFTHNPRYLEDAHHIYFNAIAHSQRSNGGFGCDTCAGAADPFLNFSNYEAHWCCTMRGGEFFARMIESIYFIAEEKIVLPFYFDNTAKFQFGDQAFVLRQKTGYPIEGKVEIEVMQSSGSRPMTLQFFNPSWIKNPHILFNDSTIPFIEKNNFIELQLDLKEGDRIDLSFDLVFQIQNTINHNSIKDYFSFRHGPLILGSDQKNEIEIVSKAKIHSLERAHYRSNNNDIILAPILDVRDIAEKDIHAYRKQILFKSR